MVMRSEKDEALHIEETHTKARYRDWNAGGFVRQLPKTNV